MPHVHRDEFLTNGVVVGCLRHCSSHVQRSYFLTNHILLSSGVVVAFASFLKHSVLFTGVDPDYDGALADINATKGWFDKYLKKQCAALGCKVSNKLGVLDLNLHGAKPSLTFLAVRYQYI